MAEVMYDQLMTALEAARGAATKIRVSSAVWDDMVTAFEAVGSAWSRPTTFATIPVEKDVHLLGRMAVVERFAADPTIVVFT